MFLGILTLESGTAYDFAIDYSQVYPGPSGMGSELVSEAYAAGVEEDNCYHSSLIQLEAGLERENGAGSGHSCACAGRRRRRRPRRGWCRSRTAEAGAGRRRASGRAPGDPKRPSPAGEAARQMARRRRRKRRRRRSGGLGGAPGDWPKTPPLARRCPSGIAAARSRLSAPAMRRESVPVCCFSL